MARPTRHTHPLVPDPLGAVEQISLVPESRERLHAALSSLIAIASHLYAPLPEQIIHGDYFPSNVLMEGNGVSGILDFEFASPGPRTMDLAIGLWAFGVLHWRTADDWPLIEAFAAGYQRRTTLAPVEIDALPALMRLREATSLIHWIGRFRQGLTNERDIELRINRFLTLEEWKCGHGDELIRRVGCNMS